MANIYMAVTSDEYELPITIADSCDELASMLGISSSTIYTRICRKTSGKNSGMRFVKIKCTDTEAKQWQEQEPTQGNGKGGKVMEIYCSRCGNHERIPRSVRGVKAKSKKGWRSFGSVIYCPECTRTWKERNDKELNTVEETNEWIYERLLKI